MDKGNTKSLWFSAHSIVRSIQWYLPATIIYRLISFIRGFILAWLLAKEGGQYSLLTLSLQIINILAPIVSCGTAEALVRYIPNYSKTHKLPAFITNSIVAVALISFTSLTVLFVLSKHIGRFLFASMVPSQELFGLTISILITIAAIIFYFIVNSILRGLRWFSVLSIFEIIHGILFCLFSILGVIWIEKSAKVVIWSYTISLLIPSFICLTIIYSQIGYSRIKEDPKPEKVDTDPVSEQLNPLKILPRFVRFGFWIASSGIVGQIWFTFSLWYLARFVSTQKADVFSASRLVSQIVIIVALTLASIISPAVYNLWQKDRRYALNILDLYTKISLLFLCIGGTIITDLRLFINRLFPTQLSSLSEVLAEQILFYYLISSIALIVIYFNLIEKTRLSFWSWAIGLAFNIICGLLWIKGEEALKGAATAMWISAIPALLATVILARQEGMYISRGQYILYSACLIFLLPTKINLQILAVFIGISFFTHFIFSEDQKRILRERAYAKIDSLLHHLK